MQFRVSNVNDLMDCGRSTTIYSCEYNAELFCEHDCSHLCKMRKFENFTLDVNANILRRTTEFLKATERFNSLLF